MTIKAGPPVVRTGLVAATAPPITVTGNATTGRVWSGEGPPLLNPPNGITVGETYVDTISGTIWRLDPGE